MASIEQKDTSEDKKQRSRLLNRRVKSMRSLLSPEWVLEHQPIPDETVHHIVSSREKVSKILKREDDRMFVVVGPCSIHDPKAALEYGAELAEIAKTHEEDLMIVMRVYFEKPRTTVGWKGLMNDPHLDGSFKINEGIALARQILLDLNALGLPCGVEWLDTITPQYISDLVTWGAIGARTTESQVHRQLASGLSMPVGFKNGTSGDTQVAVDAVVSARAPHSFLGVLHTGAAAIVETEGNDDAHVILRGGKINGENYYPENVKEVSERWTKAVKEDVSKDDPTSRKVVPPAIVIDCSHANSRKDHKRQMNVAVSVQQQLSNGSASIAGVMIESNINEGKQTLDVTKKNAHELKYGVSITDACVNIAETKEMLAKLAEGVRNRRLKNERGEDSSNNLVNGETRRV